MNEGLNLEVIEPNDGEFSFRWWTETAQMVDRGYRKFCKKRGLRHDAGNMREQIRGDALAGQARMAARLQEGSNDL